MNQIEMSVRERDWRPAHDRMRGTIATSVKRLKLKILNAYLSDSEFMLATATQSFKPRFETPCVLQVRHVASRLARFSLTIP
jgi:hypothetical protein